MGREPLPMSVAIVSYNSRDLLRACLASIESEPYEEVTVVDNASSDDSEEIIRRDFPWVRFISSQTNHGYGEAANRAIAACSSKYVFLLNPDTLLQPGTLQALCEYLDQHPQVAIAGPALCNPDGTPQVSCFAFPTPWQTLLRETRLPTLLRHLPRIHSDEPLPGSYHNAGAVPWVLGAALAIRRLAFEAVGGFDRSFFMYFEEVDLCYRLSQAGWDIHFAPVTRVVHVGGASTQQHRTAMALQLYKSLFHFYRQHYSRMQSFQLKLVVSYLMLRNTIRDIFRLSQVSDPLTANLRRDDLIVWRSVLSGVWSRKRWLVD